MSINRLQTKGMFPWMTGKPKFLHCLVFLLLVLLAPSTIFAQVSIESNLNVAVSGNTEIVISGNWLNSGNFDPGNGKVTFNGNTKQTITNPNGENFHNVTVNKAGGLLELNNPLAISGLFLLLNGDVNLNGNDITMGLRALLAETPGNTVKGRSGFIKTTRSLNAPSNNNVAGLGFEITSAANMGATEIKRGHWAQTNNGNQSIFRFFDVRPRINNNLNATLVFHYDDSELNNNVEAGLQIFRSTDGGNTWVFRGGQVNPRTNEATLTPVNEFSRWMISSDQFEPPDLEITKANDTNGMIDVNDTFQWTNSVSNTGAGDAVFADGDTIFLDNLPNGTVAYGGAAAGNFVNIDLDENIDCSITANAPKDLVCVANGGQVTIGGHGGQGAGSFNVVYDVTPSAVDTLINPRENGICRVDPNNDVVESRERNNNCTLDTVIVKGSDVELVSKTALNNSPTVGDTVIFTIIVRNNGPGTAANVVVSDTLQPGVTYVPESITHNDTARTDAADVDNGNFAANTVTVNLGKMAASQMDTVTFKVKVDLNTGGTTINNTAIVAATQDDDPNNNRKAIVIAPVGVQIVSPIIGAEALLPLWNPATHEFSFELAIQNQNQVNIFAPLFAQFTSITTIPINGTPATPVTVVNADGGGNSVGAYYDYSDSLGADNLLVPQEFSEFKRWIFFDPDDTDFFFTADVLGSPIAPPTSFAKTTGSAHIKGFVDVKNQRVEIIDTVTDVEELVPVEIPTEFYLHQNYPNPFNPETTIQYQLPEPANVKLVVFNLKGQVVRTLLDEDREAGFHEIVWDAKDDSGNTMSSGVYLYRIRAGEFTEVKKLMLLR